MKRMETKRTETKRNKMPQYLKKQIYAAFVSYRYRSVENNSW